MGIGVSERVKQEVTFAIAWDGPLTPFHKMQQVSGCLILHQESLQRYVEVYYRGYRLWQRVNPVVYEHIMSPDQRISDVAKARVCCWIAQFVASVDATLRGGYA